MRAFVRSRTPLPAPAVGPVPADHHNRALAAAQTRADELEEHLVDLLVPVLIAAGDQAAANFERLATHHLTAGGFTQDFGEADDVIAAGGVDRRSTMIAVKPRLDQARAVAEDEPAESMHVTLAYLGKTDGPLETVRDALAGVPGEHAPLEGKVGGVGCFADNGKGHPAILLPSVPGLLELRHHVTQALADRGIEYGRDYGFQPHLTVGYRPEPDPPGIEAVGTPLSFDDLWIVRGDVETVQMPLVGAKPVTAAAEVEPGAFGFQAFLEEHDGAGALAGEQDPDDEDSHDRLMGVASLAAAGEPEFCLPAGVRGVTDPVRQAAVESVMKSSLEHVGVAFDPTNPLAAKVLSQSASQIQGIAETTQLDVMRTIRAAHDEGLSIPDTAKSIRAVMAEAAPARARLIARTELAGAVNGGSLAATRIVGEATGTTYTKTWRTAPGATYPRHEDYDGLDGQTVGLDDAFDVGGSDLDFPGDPSGPPEEVCNCRCSMTYTDEGGGGEVEASAADGSRMQIACSAHGNGLTPAWIVAAEMLLVVQALTAAGPAGWTSPAPDEVLPIHCEVPAAARGVDEAAARLAEPVPAGPLPGPPVGDTISVGPAPFLPQTALDTIQRLGIDGWPPEKGPEALRILGAAKDTTNLYAPNGIWPDDRALLQRRIVNDALDGKVAARNPTAYFTSGGSASGKSSLTFKVGRRSLTADELGARTDTILVDPDAIKKMLPEFQQMYAASDPYAANGVHDESSMIAREIIAQAQARGISVVVDTTGSSTDFVGKIAAAKELGYQTQVSMMSIPTNEAIMRSLTRALGSGPSEGRFVPIQSLKYAHAGASRNAAEWMHDPAVGRWSIYDNSAGAPRLIASGGADLEATVKDQGTLDQILAKGKEGVPHTPDAVPAPADTPPVTALAPPDFTALDSLPVSSDGYVASLQNELKKLGKSIAANNYTLKTELRPDRVETLKAQIKAWETRRDDIRELIQNPDPKLESARLSKQIAAARFEIKNGRGNARLEARLKVLERRRADLKRVMSGPLKPEIEAQARKVATQRAVRSGPASYEPKTYQAGETVGKFEQRSNASWANSVLPGSGPDNYLMLEAGDWSFGGQNYKMGQAVMFRNADSGIIVRKELSPDDRFSSPEQVARRADASLTTALADLPPSMQGKLEQLTFAIGRAPSDALRHGDFRAAASADYYNAITYWNGNNLGDFAGEGKAIFDHELGHTTGIRNGPPDEVTWEGAKYEDYHHADAEFGDAADGQQRPASGGFSFILGGPNVTVYAGTNLKEDWAESVRLYLLDRRRGYIGIVDGRQVTFADAYPNRKAIMDEYYGTG